MHLWILPWLHICIYELLIYEIIFCHNSSSQSCNMHSYLSERHDFSSYINLTMTSYMNSSYMKTSCHDSSSQTGERCIHTCLLLKGKMHPYMSKRHSCHIWLSHVTHVGCITEKKEEKRVRGRLLLKWQDALIHKGKTRVLLIYEIILPWLHIWISYMNLADLAVTSYMNLIYESCHDLIYAHMDCSYMKLSCHDSSSQSGKMHSYMSKRHDFSSYINSSSYTKKTRLLLIYEFILPWLLLPNWREMHSYLSAPKVARCAHTWAKDTHVTYDWVMSHTWGALGKKKQEEDVCF